MQKSRNIILKKYVKDYQDNKECIKDMCALSLSQFHLSHKLHNFYEIYTKILPAFIKASVICF